MKRARLAAIGCTALALSAAASGKAEIWVAQPVEVHEWGVQVFRQDGSRAPSREIPPFYHTPLGIPLAPATRFSPAVRTMPADDGCRDKPVVYFRMADVPDARGEPRDRPARSPFGPVPIGIEVGFSHGEPIAWYPQADRARACPDDPPRPDILREWFAALGAPSFATREEALARLTGCGRMIRRDVETTLASAVDPEIRARVESLLATYAAPQLEWDHLRLDAAAPGGANRIPAPRDDLPPGHWVRRARDVDAFFVTNGAETEKFLFYEGKTCERPAVEILPLPSSGAHSFEVRNRSAHPVHDLHLICPSLRSFAVLEPLDPGAVARLVVCPADDPEWARTAAGSMRDRLTQRHVLACREATTRDPAAPQGRTLDGWLRADEADSLIDIWRDEFFGGDGPRLIYREDPAALDQAMPLRIYTDMHHTIDLARVGLVLVRLGG